MFFARNVHAKIRDDFRQCKSGLRQLMHINAVTFRETTVDVITRASSSAYLLQHLQIGVSCGI